MEELKILVDMVAHLPQMALWVLVGYLAYKLAVIGSIYGVIRFTVEKMHDYLVKKKVETKDIRPMLDGMVISGTLEGLIVQLHRLRRGSLNYIHQQDVDWLRDAIDMKQASDKVKEAK